MIAVCFVRTILLKTVALLNGIVNYRYALQVQYVSIKTLSIVALRQQRNDKMYDRLLVKTRCLMVTNKPYYAERVPFVRGEGTTLMQHI